jgi:hypothetical protein
MASSDNQQPIHPTDNSPDDELLRCKRSFASYCFQIYAINDSESLRRLWTRLEQGLDGTGQIQSRCIRYFLATLFEIDLFGLK